MKNVNRIITILFAGALLLSCNNVLEPPVSKQETSLLGAGNGLVRVQLGATETAKANVPMASTQFTEIVKTIMPTAPTQFSKYTVTFTADGKAPVTATIASPATEVEQVLTTGTWDVAVTAFMNFEENVPLPPLQHSSAIPLPINTEQTFNLVAGGNPLYYFPADTVGSYTVVLYDADNTGTAGGTYADCKWTVYRDDGTQTFFSATDNTSSSGGSTRTITVSSPGYILIGITGYNSGSSGKFGLKYSTSTVPGETEKEYAAASGSGTVVVAENVTTDVQVALTPLSITDSTAPKGIFSYKVTFPAGVTPATLTVKKSSGTIVSILNGISLTSDNEVSVELDSGYYDLSISLTNGAGQKAGVFDTVHLYPGLESKAEYTFTAADFTQSIYLGGTVTITNPPSGITSTTVKAYSDALCTDLKGAFTVSSGNWFGEVPVALRGQTVYLTVTVSTGSRTWTTPGSAQAITATAAGRSDIALPGTFYTLSGTIKKIEDGTGLAGAAVVLKQGAATIDTITTSANGSYSFTAFGGNYTLQISKTDYLSKYTMWH